MELDQATCCGLGVALNEADLVDVAVDAGRRTATVTLLAPHLPADGGWRTIQLLLSPVVRVAASLRLGAWNDERAATQPFDLGDLSAVVRTFGGQPIHGWEFFDQPASARASWAERLSLDWRATEPALARHTLELFQEGPTRHLDLCLWFDDLEILDERGLRLDVAAFVAGGTDFWHALRRRDPQVVGRGLFPL